MRCYTFCNMYLQGIHAGIQSAHSIARMFVKYADSSPSSNPTLLKTLSRWAKNYETMICLDGGYSSNLLSIEAELASISTYAWSSFRESEEALNSAITNVAIIIPEYVYAAASDVRTGKRLELPIVGECGVESNLNGSSRVCHFTADDLVVINLLLSHPKMAK